MGFDDLSDEEKMKLLQQMKGDTMSSGEFKSSSDMPDTPNNSITPGMNGMMGQKSIPDRQDTVTSNPLVEGAKSFGETASGMVDSYDKNVNNRIRAAALAKLQGRSGLDAIKDNPDTSGQDIAHEAFKTLNPEVQSDTGVPLMKQGEALKGSEYATGKALDAALDPMWAAGPAIGGIKEATALGETAEGLSNAGKLTKEQQLKNMHEDYLMAKKRFDEISNGFYDTTWNSKTDVGAEKKLAFQRMQNKLDKLNKYAEWANIDPNKYNK